MTTARLTYNPLLYVDFWYRFKLTHEIFLGHFSFRNHGLCRGYRAGVVADAGARNIFAINHPSVSTKRVADRDAVVERHKESIGVPVKKAYAIGHMGMTTLRMRW
jgi:hypothetical protein